MYAYEILFYTVMTEKKLLGETSKSKLEIFFYIHFRFILIIMRHFESHLKLKSKIRQLILAGVH